MQKRLLFYELKKHITHKNALIITGMRQVGKTTLMRQLYDEINTAKLWYDLDNPLDQKIFESLDYHSIYAYLTTQVTDHKQRLTVFLDEVQNLPQITKVIKFLLDQYGVKFIITGSSSFYLKHLFPESLSGRKFLYELYPLAFREFLYFKNILSFTQANNRSLHEQLLSANEIEYIRRKQYYDEYVAFGGFPEVVMNPDSATKKLILKNIFAIFFEKDLQLLSDYKDMRELRDLILLLVPRVGSMLDITKIASELGVERTKIYAYLEFLQKTFFIRLIPKYTLSIDRSVAGGKKIYFTDTGILNTIGTVNDGQQFENAVMNQLILYGTVSFYNQRNVTEIDAIINKDTAIEIKLTGTQNDYVKLLKWANKIHINNVWIMSKTHRSFAHCALPHFL
ncbi:MAG: ATP-binding protein [Candidatus Gottesmanbacteria bacterium]|nr:ATP-binding protein [Candidatus Gottesmanbacteria bacterium]